MSFIPRATGVSTGTAHASPLATRPSRPPSGCDSLIVSVRPRATMPEISGAFPAA
jgi:hypothetical protein